MTQVLLAAGGTYIFVSRWPDIVVGAIIAGLFLSSALSVLRQSLLALYGPPPVPPSQNLKPVALHLSTKEPSNPG